MPALAFITGLIGLAISVLGTVSVLWFSTPVNAETRKQANTETSEQVRWICTFSGAGQQASCVLPTSAS